MKLFQMLSTKVNFLCLNVVIKAIGMTHTGPKAFKSLWNTVIAELALHPEAESLLKIS